MRAWQFDMLLGFKPFDAPTLRYNLLRRVASGLRARGVVLLAFGLGADSLRVVVEGGEDEVWRAIRAAKSATVREARRHGVAMAWKPAQCLPFDEVDAAIAWAHGAVPGLPLETPWTSHRDLLGFRVADFFDPGPARARADIQRVHTLAGGGPAPVANVGPDDVEEADLRHLMRVAAAAVGVLPAERSSFRLFVHAARSLGYSTAELADALALSRRRVRQLAEGDEPLLPVCLAHLTDARLRAVP